MPMRPGALTRRISRAILAVAIAAAVAAPPIPAAAADALRCDGPLATAPVTGLDPDYADLLRLVDGWSTRQRVGHLLVLGIPGTGITDALRERIEDTAPAGVLLLGRNVEARAQLSAFVEAIRESAHASTGGVSPFIATDFEGGTVNAVRAITGPTPSAQQLAGGGEAGVVARGEADAAILRGLGINVNLAPVADIRPPDGGFIGSRSFAATAPAVASLATAYAHGLRAGGIVPVLKHFPGHGRASGDSHLLLPVLAHDRDRLQAEDLRPFADALRAGEPGMVMVGHVLVPAIDPLAPASLSGPVVDGLLRRDLGFGGVVITDELKMRAVSAERDVVQAATAALAAGVDLVLSDYSPAEHARVVDALAGACERGDLPGSRLAAALARVLHLKSSFGLVTPQAARRLEAWRAERDFATLPFRPGHDGPDGRFFPAPVLVGPPSPGLAPGFTITDEEGIMLYREYVDRGGAARLGRPLSRRFLLGGEVVQLVEGGLLRWRPEAGGCDLLEGQDALLAAGVAPADADAWLLANGRRSTAGEGSISRAEPRAPSGGGGAGGGGVAPAPVPVGEVARASGALPPEATAPLPWSPPPAR